MPSGQVLPVLGRCPAVVFSSIYISMQDNFPAVKKDLCQAMVIAYFERVYKHFLGAINIEFSAHSYKQKTGLDFECVIHGCLFIRCVFNDLFLVRDPVHNKGEFPQGLDIRRKTRNLNCLRFWKIFWPVRRVTPGTC